MQHKTTVESRNYELRNNAMSWKYNRFIENAVMEVSIEKSHYNDKYRYFTGFSGDRALS